MENLSIRIIAIAVLFSSLTALSGSGQAEQGTANAARVDIRAHWAARATLGNVLMFSGLGEPLEVPMPKVKRILEHAGFTERPPMPDMAIIGAIYAAGSPAFVEEPDLDDPSKLRWDPESFDRTLDPEAQAWAIIKSMSPEFHLQYHQRKEEKRMALMMVPQAQEQAQVLGDRLLTPEGLFAPRTPDGEWLAVSPRAQAAVLWSASNLILAATSDRNDYWHQAVDDLLDAGDYEPLANVAFDAVEKLPPETDADRGIAIEALGRYALAIENNDRQRRALDLVRKHADAIARGGAASLEDLGLGIYGLVEAGRLLKEQQYMEAAFALFEEQLTPRWNEQCRAFSGSEENLAYTDDRTAALVAGLNAIRWHGSSHLAEQADRMYSELFEALFVRAGLLQSSPLPLVDSHYLEQESASRFAHPDLPLPPAAGVAPVFASAVAHEEEEWRLTDPSFGSAGGLLLSNMLAMPTDGRADIFVTDEELAALEGGITREGP